MPRPARFLHFPLAFIAASDLALSAAPARAAPVASIHELAQQEKAPLLDTPQTINDGDYDSWVCDTSSINDFASQGDLDLAKDLSGCGGFTDADNTDFKDNIEPGTTLRYCVAFDNSFTNEIFFQKCANLGAGDYPAPPLQ